MPWINPFELSLLYLTCDVFVSDISQRTLARGRVLIPELEEARNNNKQAFLATDRLVIRDNPPNKHPFQFSNDVSQEAQKEPQIISHDDEIKSNTRL